MKLLKRGLLLSSLSLMTVTTYGQATMTDQVTLTLEDAVEIRFKPDATPILTYNFDEASDYQNNVRANNAAILQVSSNADWVISVKSGTNNFTYTGSTVPAPVMPSTVLKIRNRPDPRINLQPTDTQIASGTSGSWIDNEVALRYIARPRFNYPAGTYTIPVIYTVSKQ